VSEKIKRINIIGGGFCGTMVAYHLVHSDHFPASVAIHIYDRAGLHGRGIAYSTPFIEHLLNVPAAGMSALPDCPDDFYLWLRKNAQADANPKEFYPRRLYGDYLSDFLSRAIATAKNKNIPLVLEQADGPLPQKDSITVYATGVSTPRWPAGIRPDDDSRAIDHPYGDAALAFYESINGNMRNITILGTGLSATDAILSLVRAGYAGHIKCIARKGLWPMPHGPKNAIWHWRRWVDSIRPYSNPIWRKLPVFIKKFALARITYWNVIRHRMPPQCHKILRDLIEQGRLKTYKGNIQAVIHNGNAFVVETNKGAIESDAVINCLGFVDVAGQGQSFIQGPGSYILGPPLFGKLIETTAVPELRVQAQDCAEQIIGALKTGTAPG